MDLVKVDNWIVVPEGLAADENGIATEKPSWIYQAVLDFVGRNARSEKIFLAPANAFGSLMREHEAAQIYLKKYPHLILANIDWAQEELGSSYIDTYGNALKLNKKIKLGEEKGVALVVYCRHSRRAVYHFKRFFHISKVIKVYPENFEKKPIVSRLWYYNYPFIHGVYEAIALVRDILKYRIHGS